MRRERSSHSHHPGFHPGGLFFLLAAVVFILVFFYSCTGGPVYGLQGRLVFFPLAQIGGRSMTLTAPMQIFLQKMLDFTPVQ